MPEVDEAYYRSLCHSLAKGTTAAVRLYRGSECRYYYSVFHLHPDPAGPFLSQLLDNAHPSGVITTPLLQFYGFFTIAEDWRIIIGPSRMENEERQLLEEQFFLLGIPQEQKEEFGRLLRCSPEISAERMSWLISFLASALEQRVILPDQLFVNVRPAERHGSLSVEDRMRHGSDEKRPLEKSVPENGRDSYEMEKLLIFYIEHGEPEKLREFYSAPPSAPVGHLSDDTVRQLRDLDICTATVAARAAIAGGIDPRDAFQLSDLYIQKIELVRNAASLQQMMQEIVIDFACQVQRLRFNTLREQKSDSKDYFRACADYVSQNIYSTIRVEKLAETLGYSRTYLCGRFKAQTGLTLSQYIQQQKITEAQRMLEFTNRNLTEISQQLAFSSQSHFQTVFKSLTGETPMNYRNRVTRR